ncbi:glycerol-3-phosphate 1-O-acyltransferase PlsY [Bacilliculturomica massiliensis]|uniref:glycerol-3-phosphate 1-O-acyltransferase PlsY n=1 Tax=Bacilliculturomica massiliensis TaxID=1917867 RepID=UPI00102F872A|nr:glycerol-3-phosphate 1-O-acyltransferase PlsY [Bacilliculturomica massiliensis]
MYSVIVISQMSWEGAAVCLIAALAAYFIGNISPAILIGRLHGIDIKKEGSGNAGTTNVLRVLGKKAAAETLLVDIFKGVLAVWLGRLAGTYFLPEADLLAMICCAAVLLGHIWPVFFGFRGGKGIATGFGALVTFQWQIGLGLLLIAVTGIVLSRRVSVGSVLAALSLPVLAWFFAPDYILPLSLLALIVLWKHRSNIVRICKGQEPKISFKK